MEAVALGAFPEPFKRSRRRPVIVTARRAPGRVRVEVWTVGSDSSVAVANLADRAMRYAGPPEAEFGFFEGWARPPRRRPRASLFGSDYPLGLSGSAAPSRSGPPGGGPILLGGTVARDELPGAPCAVGGFPY